MWLMIAENITYDHLPKKQALFDDLPIIKSDGPLRGS